MKGFFVKTRFGLAPEDPVTREWFDKLKLGQGVSGEFRKVRNVAFHRKYFALLNVGYDNWEPGAIDSKYGIPQKNFNRFRADVTILAGFYDITIRLDGSARVEPKSISFASMDEDEFAQLYSATIDVLLKYVYDRNMDAESLDKLVNEYLNFV